MEAFLVSQEIEEVDQSKQFEMFAAYCAVEQHYNDIYDLADIITAEGEDCGIDAVAIIVNGTMVTSTDEIDDLIDLNKYLSEINIIFIQAKTKKYVHFKTYFSCILSYLTILIVLLIFYNFNNFFINQFNRIYNNIFKWSIISRSLNICYSINNINTLNNFTKSCITSS